jgi:IS5 family transposase
MRKVVLTSFVIFGTTGQVVADDLSDRFRNDFDGTLARALRIPSVASPNPVPFAAPKPRPRPRHDISPNAAPPAARVPTAEPAIGHLKTDHHVATGREGDRAHALLATAGHNFHLLMDWFGKLWHRPNHTGSER